MDRGEASCTFLMDPPQRRTGRPPCRHALGLDAGKLPPIRDGARDPGRRHGGGRRGDGAARRHAGAGRRRRLSRRRCSAPASAARASPPTSPGTSCIITVIAERRCSIPRSATSRRSKAHWGAFVLLETGGDAMRWARRAFHRKRRRLRRIVVAAAAAPAGLATACSSCPISTGERLGSHRNARAQFFGLAAAHGLPDLQRAVWKAWPSRRARHLRIMEAAAGGRVERVIASSGGAKSRALAGDQGQRLRACPSLVPTEAECGRDRLRRHGGRLPRAAFDAAGRRRCPCALPGEILPDPPGSSVTPACSRSSTRFIAESQGLYDALDTLASDP